MTAFLFDMDGVVVDNMRFHERAWREFFLKRGVPMDGDEFFRRTSGMPTRDVMAYFFKRALSAEEAARLNAEKEAAYRRLYAPHLSPLPGLREFLAAARAAGVRLGLGTGSLAENIDFVLDGLSLRDRFDAVVGADEVRRGKPDPETFLTLARKLGAAPADCVVFEDALLGEEAARAAGMRLVAVTTTHASRDFRRPDLSIADFSGLDPRAIAGLGRRSKADSR